MHRIGASGVLVARLAAVSLIVGVGSASASRIDPPGHPEGNHCVNAFGVDLNELYGISDQFRTRECRVISAGEHWTRPLLWVTNFGAESVYPAGYVPSRPEPSDDFLAKLVALNVVIDPGTPRERTHVFDARAIARTDIDVEEIEPGSAGGVHHPMTTLLPRLRPLSVGDHFAETSLVLSDEHCDGFSADRELNCLPAGETLFFPHPVTVTTPEQGPR